VELQFSFVRHGTHKPTFGPFNAQRGVLPEQSVSALQGRQIFSDTSQIGVVVGQLEFITQTTQRPAC